MRYFGLGFILLMSAINTTVKICKDGDVADILLLIGQGMGVLSAVAYGMAELSL